MELHYDIKQNVDYFHHAPPKFLCVSLQAVSFVLAQGNY